MANELANRRRFFAHVTGVGTGEIPRRETLAEHLRLTSELSRRFSAAFGMERTGELIGKCHDFGKASESFQRYLLDCGDSSEDGLDDAVANGKWRKGPDHSMAGVRWLALGSELGKQIGALLVYVVAGHHAGLPDGNSESRSRLQWRIEQKEICDWEENARATFPSDFFASEAVAKPSVPWTRLSQTRRARTGTFDVTRLRQSRPRVLQSPRPFTGFEVFEKSALHLQSTSPLLTLASQHPAGARVLCRAV